MQNTQLFGGGKNFFISGETTLVERTLLTENKIQSISDTFTNAKGSMFLGRGLSYSVALEGALKLKELSYVHAEGYPAGEMKHGPVSYTHLTLPTICSV